MHFKLLIATAVLVPSISFAANCKLPDFIEMTFNGVEPEQKTVFTSVAGMLRIGIPSGFEGIAFSGDATVFGYPNNGRVVIGIETPAAIALHEPGAKPEPFYRNVFMGRTVLGCKYLETYKLEQEDYRIRSKIGPMDIFAYGKASVHEVVVLHAGRPDTVIRMRFSGYDRRTFESLLSTIKSE